MKKLLFYMPILLINSHLSIAEEDSFISMLKEKTINDVVIEMDNAWLCLDNGELVKANVAHQEFYIFDFKISHSESSLHAIAIDPQGVKWIAADNGAYRLENGQAVWFNTEDGLPADPIVSVCVDRDQNVWFGTAGNNICRFDGFIWEVIRITEGTNRVFSIKSDSENNIWIGVSGDQAGIYKYNEGIRDTVKLDFYGDRNSSMAVDPMDRLWIATGEEWIYMYNREQTQRFGKEDGVICSRISSLRMDQRGNLWTYDPAKGLSFFNGTGWTSFSNNMLEIFLEKELDHVIRWKLEGNTEYYAGKSVDGDSLIYFLDHARVFDTKQDHDTLWLATGSGYIVKLVPRLSSFELIQIRQGKDLHLYSIAIDQNGIKWITSCAGVYRFDNHTITRFTEEDGLAFNCVGPVTVDHQNRKWFGAEAVSKISVYNDAYWETYFLDKGAWGYSIEVDSSDHKWIGGGDPGVIEMDENDSIIRRFDTPDIGHLTNSILVDHRDHKWFLVYGDHVIEYANDSLTYYGPGEGMRYNSTMSSLFVDQTGNIWSLDLNGISMYNGKQWVSFPTGLMEIFLLTNLDNSLWTHNPVLVKRSGPGVFHIFPNPVRESVQILTDPQFTGGIYSILDMKGRMIRTGTLLSEQQTICLQGISAGAYVLEIKYGFTKHTKHFIIK